MSERQRRMIDEAEKSCARLVAIVAELSDISKLDGGQLKLARQPFDLFASVEKVAELLHQGHERDGGGQSFGYAGRWPVDGADHGADGDGLGRIELH